MDSFKAKQNERDAQLDALRAKLHKVVDAYIDNLIDDAHDMDEDELAERIADTMTPADALDDINALDDDFINELGDL